MMTKMKKPLILKTKSTPKGIDEEEKDPAGCWIKWCNRCEKQEVEMVKKRKVYSSSLSHPTRIAVTHCLL